MASSAPRLLGVLCLVLAANAASTYYISPFGSNSNSGTSANSPFQDLATALSAASSGATIYAADGFYTGTSNVGLEIESINLIGSSSGTVFQGDGSDIFSLTGSMTLSTLSLKSSGAGKGLTISGNDVTIDTVSFSSLKIGLALGTSAKNVTISNSSFSSSVTYGMYFSGSSSYDWQNIVVEDTTFDCSGHGVEFYSISSYSNDWATFSLTNCQFTTTGLSIDFSSGVGAQEVILDGCTFTGTSSDTDCGGAVITTHYGVTVKDSAFTDCTSEYGDGGALAVYDTSTLGLSQFTVSNSIFTHCSSSEGGAIYASGTSLTVQGSVFVNNTASSSGGAISTSNSYNDNNALVISSSSFGYNSADGVGGALDLNGAKASCSISGSDFGMNMAETNGGAIYFYTNTDGVTLSISDSQFLSNAADELGGAIYQKSANIQLSSGVSFMNNTADKGGAVYSLADTVFSAQQMRASGNIADGDGGAFYFMQSSGSFSTCLFESNEGASGGAIYGQGTAAINVQSAILALNQASVSGGAIACTGGGVNISRGLFFLNSSPNGASYSCSGSCGIYATSSYVPSNSTDGCSALSLISEGADFGVTRDSFAPAMSREEAQSRYGGFLAMADAIKAE